MARPLLLESLEHRVLLAADITLRISGELLIIGDGSDNVVQVHQSADQILVDGGADGSFSFSSSAVRRVRFLGRAGDDQFTNHTSIPTVAYGNQGNDKLTGGSGADRLYGGPGDDCLLGNAGDDELHGDYGDDLLVGGDGNDSAYGWFGDDTLLGDAGNDYLSGWAGSDLLIGGKCDDHLRGHAGRDFLIGGKGTDRLDGGSGQDILVGGWTKYDDQLDVLDRILADWRRDDPFELRVQRLSAGVDDIPAVNKWAIKVDGKPDTFIRDLLDADWQLVDHKDLV